MEIAERHAGETDDSKEAEETRTVLWLPCAFKEERGRKKRE